jgi:hypothetical protein
MNVVLWVAALRVLAALLTVSIVWPSLLQPWRWARRVEAQADTRRIT